MLSREDNALLTETGPDKPMGRWADGLSNADALVPLHGIARARAERSAKASP